MPEWAGTLAGETRMRTSRWTLMVAAAVLWAPPATALEFEYRADRFEVSGQTTFVDEFDDGVLAPWTSNLGTASESGGVLLLENPGGITNPLELVGGPSLEISNALAPAGANVADGAGDFVATSSWLDLPGPPSGPLGGFYTMQLFSSKLSTEPTCIALSAAAGEPVSLETTAVTLAMRNLDPIEPPFTGPAGLAAVFTLTRMCLAGLADPFDNRAYLRAQVDAVSVDPGDVTGDIVFELAFSDASNTVTPRFSLNSGSSFTTMTALPAFDPFVVGRFQLLARPVQPPAVPVFQPIAFGALALALGGSGALFRRRGATRSKRR